MCDHQLIKVYRSTVAIPALLFEVDRMCDSRGTRVAPERDVCVLNRQKPLSVSGRIPYRVTMFATPDGGCSPVYRFPLGSASAVPGA